jgi:2',3'-cyclic-nucleotide 2'-phosphodiesterase (5'-nucleotidase family)
VSYIIDQRKAVDVQINDKPLDPDRIYSFALPDYIANGGDHCTFLADAEKRVDLDYLVRDAIIDYVRLLTKVGRNIEAMEDGRVTNVDNH